ncbi:flagellar biosynthetic protein FliO [Rahnella variigena]|nr:flagellar biosynthetic protein FliO [Rahnella variigena]
MPAGSVLTQVSSVLGGILLLILFIGWVVKRAGFAPQSKNNKLLKVTASVQVGRSEKVVIVEVDNTWLVLGVTAQNITPLHTLSAPPVEQMPDSSHPNNAPADFRQLMQKMLKRPGKQA